MDKALENFQVNSNGDFDIFWHKLCKENNWSLSFSKNAFYEYKRFIYLAKINGCKVVPSKIIDTVWHLHMTFTKSYWNELCQEILQEEFHHVPSSQGENAEILDNECYENTKKLYNKEFRCIPPSLYWPLPKKHKTKKLFLGIVSISCLTLLTACTSSVFNDIEPIIKWVIGIYAVYKVFSWLGGGSGGSGSGCSSSGGSHCSSSCGGSSCGGGD